MVLNWSLLLVSKLLPLLQNMQECDLLENTPNCKDMSEGNVRGELKQNPELVQVSSYMT